MGRKNSRTDTAQVPALDPDADSPPMEFLEYVPSGKRSNKMPGGAFDPYERTLPSGDTVRMQRPRTDLRELSRWIKLQQEVEANSEQTRDLPEKPKVP